MLASGLKKAEQRGETGMKIIYLPKTVYRLSWPHKTSSSRSTRTAQLDRMDLPDGSSRAPVEWEEVHTYRCSCSRAGQ